jgi:hypothetical protein
VLYSEPGVAYERDYDYNKFTRLSIAENTLTSVSLHSTPTLVDSENSTYIIEPFNNFVYKVDTEKTEIIKQINVGTNPAGGALTVLPGSSSDKCIWLSITDENKIICLDALDATVTTITGFNRPLGIDASGDGKTIAVANNSASSPSVSVLTYNTTTKSWTKNDVVMPSKPYGVFVDVNGLIWVSLQQTDQTVVIAKDLTTSNIVTGVGQRSIKAYDDNFFK